MPKSSPPKIVIYGLSTEGYNFASSLVSSGHNVSIIDECSKMGIPLNNNIIGTYSTVSDLIVDESLLQNKSIDSIISGASYLFFSPKIRKVGHDVKIDISSKFIDAIKPISKDTSIIYMLPTGIGGNDENIDILEYTTGMTTSDHINYYYMPLNSGPVLSVTTILGSLNNIKDVFLEELLQNFNGQQVTFSNVGSVELNYVSRILRHYSGIASVLEVCRYAKADIDVENKFIDNFHRDLYLDDLTNGLHDLRIIQNSLQGSSPLVYLVNGTIKSIENYLKNIIDNVRYLLKKRELKASKTKISILWTLDLLEMRGDKMDIFSSLESRLRDYIGEVNGNGTNGFDNYQSDKTSILIACSKNDFNLISKYDISDSIVMKANPICETI